MHLLNAKKKNEAQVEDDISVNGNENVNVINK